MKKFFLLAFIILDVAVMAAAALFLVSRLNARKTAMLHTVTPMPVVPRTPSPVEPMKPGMPLTATPHPVVSTRKILFAYRNSRAKSVMIRADFTNWKAEPMQKEANNRWTYMALLEPGEYAYLFFVDNRSIRDPANKHVKQVGKIYVSSVVVKPAVPAVPTPAH